MGGYFTSSLPAMPCFAEVMSGVCTAMRVWQPAGGRQKRRNRSAKKKRRAVFCGCFIRSPPFLRFFPYAFLGSFFSTTRLICATLSLNTRLRPYTAKKTTLGITKLMQA